MEKRSLFSAVLLLSVIPAILAPSVNSQSSTTVVSYVTTTVYNRVLTVSSSVSTITYVDQLSINPPSFEACGATKYDLLHGNPGDDMIISISSTSSLDFFVFASLDDYDKWEYDSPCDFGSVSNAIVKQQGVSSYAFHLTLPNSVAVIAFLYTSQGSSVADITVTQIIYRQVIATVQGNITITDTLQALLVSKANMTDTSKGSGLATDEPIVFGSISTAIILTIGFVFQRIASNKRKTSTRPKRKTNETSSPTLIEDEAPRSYVKHIEIRR